MIFSSQLGKLDGQTNEQALKTVANHLRKLQEELEYRLANLDSSNINEIDADETSITAGGENISNVLQDNNGNMSALQQTVNGLSSTVATQGKSISTLEQTAEKLSGTVSDLETGQAHMLMLDSSGVYIVDAEGNVVSISGGQIDADTLNVDAANVSGVLDANILILEGLMSIASGHSLDEGGNIVPLVRGHIGCSYTTANGYGIVVFDQTMSSFFRASSSGAKIVHDSNEIYVIDSGCWSTSAMQTGSDRRLKNSIEYDMEKYEDVFKRLKPCSYYLNGDTEAKRHWGFIAQDFAEGITAAGIEENEIAALGYDGNYYGIGYTELVPLNTHMIQKLMARVDELEKRVEQLEDK